MFFLQDNDPERLLLGERFFNLGFRGIPKTRFNEQLKFYNETITLVLYEQPCQDKHYAL